jgi:hypothetical protein
LTRRGTLPDTGVSFLSPSAVWRHFVGSVVVKGI